MASDTIDLESGVEIRIEDDPAVWNLAQKIVNISAAAGVGPYRAAMACMAAMMTAFAAAGAPLGEVKKLIANSLEASVGTDDAAPVAVGAERRAHERAMGGDA